eukprot:6344085-Amphidinium_carterae.1
MWWVIASPKSTLGCHTGATLNLSLQAMISRVSEHPGLNASSLTIRTRGRTPDASSTLPPNTYAVS